VRSFSALYRNIDTTTSNNEKVRVLAEYFHRESSRNALWAVYLLSGKSRKRTVTSRALREYFLGITAFPQWIVEECYSYVGDTAEAVALLLVCSDLEKNDSMEEIPLYRWLETEIPSLGLLDEQQRRERVKGWWSGLESDQLFILNKILTGGFRVGVSQKLLVKALSRAFGVPEPVLTHRLMGNWEPNMGFFEMLVSTEEAFMPPGQPYPFFLASALEDEGVLREGTDRWQAEWKWDGIRAQAIRRKGMLFLWSRGEDLVTEQFPELLPDMMNVPDGTVLDGEIVAWGDGTPLPFQYLQKRLGRKRVTEKQIEETPIHFMVYDLLEFGGEDIRSRSLRERQKLLATLLNTRPFSRLSLSEPLRFSRWEELKALRGMARERGVEGLMIKDLSSAYGVGRKKGYWWKYKVDPLSLDAVLIYAQPGSGKRANLFTDYTFALWQGEELVPFAKAYSGLSNQEIEELDRWIRRNTVERFGPVRAVRPHQVFEIGFEGISRSNRHKSGVAVRFPRILRWRKDKQHREADSLQSALELIG